MGRLETPLAFTSNSAGDVTPFFVNRIVHGHSTPFGMDSTSSVNAISR
jgi:hypothetical protein